MKFAYLLFCCLVLCSVSYAQKVQFDGLKRTQSAYLLKFIGWTGEAKLNAAYLSSATQLIKNTRLFSEVHHELIIDGADTTVKFICKEIQTLLPILEFGSTQGNSWFRLGLENGHF